MRKEGRIKVPVWMKSNLTIDEASEYFILTGLLASRKKVF